MCIEDAYQQHEWLAIRCDAAFKQPSFGTDLHARCETLPVYILATHIIQQASKSKRKVIFKRAESYVKEYLAKEKEEIRLKRVARATGDFYVTAQPKVYFVIRIRGYVLISIFICGV